MDGLFSVVNRLFGIHIKEHKEIDTYHPTVRFYEITDANGETRGFFYMDLYARAGKLVALGWLILLAQS